MTQVVLSMNHNCILRAWAHTSGRICVQSLCGAWAPSPRPLSSCTRDNQVRLHLPTVTAPAGNSTRLTRVSPPRCDNHRSRTKEHVAFQSETHCGSRAKLFRHRCRLKVSTVRTGLPGPFGPDTTSPPLTVLHWEVFPQQAPLKP